MYIYTLYTQKHTRTRQKQETPQRARERRIELLRFSPVSMRFYSVWAIYVIFDFSVCMCLCTCVPTWFQHTNFFYRSCGVWYTLARDFEWHFCHASCTPSPYTPQYFNVVVIAHHWTWAAEKPNTCMTHAAVQVRYKRVWAHAAECKFVYWNQLGLRLSGHDPVSGGFPYISIYFHFYVEFRCVCACVSLLGCVVACLLLVSTLIISAPLN